jgi:hypothetical protein
MDPEKRKIDPDQTGIDIRPEILNQISEGLVGEDDKENGRKVLQESSKAFVPSQVRRELEDEKKTQEQGIEEKLGSPEWNSSLKREGKKKKPDEKQKREPFCRSQSFHGKMSIS